MKEGMFRDLLAAKVGHEVTIRGVRHGFQIGVLVGNEEKTLCTSRETVRKFASLDTACNYLRSFGLIHFAVDLQNYVPGRLRKPRPDRAAALRNARTTMRQESLVL